MALFGAHDPALGRRGAGEIPGARAMGAEEAAGELADQGVRALGFGAGG